jgi:hypothetical protein
VARSDLESSALAARGGFAADRPAFAFAAGYQAALRHLMPSLSSDAMAALCVTESTGARPRDLRTTLEASGDGFTLSGQKTYVTLGHAANLLIVAAICGERPDGAPRLSLAQVSVPRPGVTLTSRPPLPFVPELGHVQVDFEAAAIGADEVLPGDGYDDFVKPFRTIEDLHVNVAMTAWVLRVARLSGWPRESIEDLVGLITTGVQLARVNPKSATVHLALAAHLRHIHAVLERNAEHWSLVDPVTRSRWLRDRPLLGLAKKTQAARTAAAWMKLDVPTPAGQTPH